MEKKLKAIDIRHHNFFLRYQFCTLYTTNKLIKTRKQMFNLISDNDLFEFQNIKVMRIYV